MKENIFKHIKCSSKRGYTLVELLVVIIIIGFILAFGAELFGSTINKFEGTRVKTVDAVSDIKSIVYIDKLLQGCDGVEIIDNSLVIKRSTGIESFKAGKFGKENEDITFTKYEDNGTKILINIGGEEYCLPVILRKPKEEV